MNKMIAMCGLTCSECEAYLATQANDQAAKVRIAEQWRQQFNAPGINADYVTCDGCTAVDGRPGGHCLECKIRACGLGRNIPNCAHCADFDTCSELAGFMNGVPVARDMLYNIRSTVLG